MWKHAREILIGKPLRNEALGGQKYSVLTGLPILSSDAISSVAYASEEILIVLIGIGTLAYEQLAFVSGAIILLLMIVTFSYMQTIPAYPNGGGSFVVASDNLGTLPGLTAGASLSVGYILTVAVSISSGTAAVTSAFPALLPYTVPICLCFLLLLTLGNLRGIREASRIFSIPTYAFIALMLITILVGVIKFAVTGGTPHAAQPLPVKQNLSLMLLLSAFSNGCAALTGVEAVSNSIPNFKEPQIKNAKRVLLLLSLFVLLLFGGVSILANLYHAVPAHDNTVLSQIVCRIYGGGFMYYLIQGVTMILLVMAANTSFSGFPQLASLMGHDGYAPRQLAMRGDRLGFSNGILALSAVAGVLIVVFRGNTNALIPLYAIGVFISFTLSQFGMFKHWLRRRATEPHWLHKAVINGFGAFVTAVVVLIIGTTKFTRGAWFVIVLIPLLVIGMLVIRKHYADVAQQLKVSNDELEREGIDDKLYRNRVIVPVASINRASLRALRYAMTISDHVVAFSVVIDEETEKKVREKYAHLHTKVPLVVRYSPYRKIVEPLLEFIESEEYQYKKGDMVTVILPEFEVHSRWEKFLHNGSGRYIARQLLRYKHIVVATMPLQLKSDEGLLKIWEPGPARKGAVSHPADTAKGTVPAQAGSASKV